MTALPPSGGTPEPREPAAWVLRCDAGNIPPDQMYATEQAAWDVLRLHRLACPGGHEIDPVRPEPREVQRRGEWLPVAEILDMATCELPDWLRKAFGTRTVCAESDFLSVRIAPATRTVAYRSDWLVWDGERIRVERGTPEPPARPAAGTTPPDGDDAIRPLSDLRTSGLLWLINRVVFHPRGYALALVREQGEITGWRLLGDGSEVWQFGDPEDALFEAAEATLATSRSAALAKAERERDSLARRCALRYEEIDRLRALLDEILSQFTEPGHPGRPCHRTGWVRDDHLAKWREAARQHGGTDGV